MEKSSKKAEDHLILVAKRDSNGNRTRMHCGCLTGKNTSKGKALLVGGGGEEGEVGF